MCGFFQQAFEDQFPSLFWFHAGGFWKGMLLLALLLGSLLIFYCAVRFMNNGVSPF